MVIGRGLLPAPMVVGRLILKFMVTGCICCNWFSLSIVIGRTNFVIPLAPSASASSLHLLLNLLYLTLLNTVLSNVLLAYILGASSLLSIIPKLFLSLQFNEESMLSVKVLLGICNLEYTDALALDYLRLRSRSGDDSDYIRCDGWLL